MLTQRTSRIAAALLGLLATAGVTREASADLVLHLDPNVLSTQYGALGQTPVAGIGSGVRWITDARSTTPGGLAYDDWIDAEANADNPILVAHPTQGSVWSLDGSAQRMLMRRDDTLLSSQGRQDGFGAAYDTNTLTTIVVGRIGTGGTGVDYLFDMAEGGFNNGYGLRYNHDTLTLQGYADQTENTSIDLPVNEWFVARYVWNGAASTATLTVDTAAGINTVTNNAASSAALATVSEMRLGTRTLSGSTATRFLGNLGDLMIYNDAVDHTAVATELAEQYIHGPQLVINRDTGTASFVRPSGGDLTNVVGYTIHSPSGTLTPTGWLSIANNYDSQSPGPDQLDPNNVWLTTSAPTSRTELSEEASTSLGGAANGATFVVDDPTDFGTIWTSYYQEDVTIELQFDNGSSRTVKAIFEGNNGQAFQYGDLNFDGLVNAQDFLDVFRTNYGADTSSLEFGPERYVLGDMNEDGAITYSDFFRLKNAIIAATPEDVSLLTFHGHQVPEPGSFSLLALAVAVGVVGSRRLMRPQVAR
ncbi:dockerin type I domain-containing protein [Aeoliella sp. SH292]|uniref:dockerin type I domain-containing protein n=1 Tax=Aeoliella sp. SH292 TaxID=3454464 RepID=UPI003F9C3E3B